ncbi:hypothetical protein [Methanococcoides seepicolus]|uniref:hypothetical protein n=1 Tax=Methanococcoides seepicolus TaxID=2828780 RepID=UPI002032F5EA|nr:hypothetical protein [Methanococcoides seepicolus]
MKMLSGFPHENNVVTFITCPEIGFNPGIERVIGELSNSLANKGHEVNVITTFRNAGEL